LPRLAGIILFLAANDSVITGLIGAKRVADVERVLSNLKQKLIIDGAGHWVQQERANEVNAALIAFLGDCGREKRAQ
jgi:pimeloyl-ACP methyl ester carboxylesterase